MLKQHFVSRICRLHHQQWWRSHGVLNMKEEDVAGLRVADLKEELKKRGLATSGLKAALAERLLESIKQEVRPAVCPKHIHTYICLDYFPVCFCVVPPQMFECLQ